MGLPALRADSRFPRPEPARIAVEWFSGRVDVVEVGGEPATVLHLIQLRRLTRAFSDCSPQVKRAWIEDRAGNLLYVAVEGRGQSRKEAPID